VAANARNLFDIRPKLRQDVVFLPSREGLVLRAAVDSVHIQGRSAYRLLTMLSRHLDGTRTLEQICAGLREPHRRAVADLIGTLLGRGLVVDSRQSVVEHGHGPVPRVEPAVRDRFGAQIEFLDHLRAGAMPRFARFRTARILLAGFGESLFAAAVGLLRNGLLSLDILSGSLNRPHLDGLTFEADRLRRSGVAASVHVAPDLESLAEKYSPSTTTCTAPRTKASPASQVMVRTSAIVATAHAATAEAATRSAAMSIRRGRVTRSSSTPSTGPDTRPGMRPAPMIRDICCGPACRATTATTAAAVVVNALPKTDAVCPTRNSRRS
jgi:hypothetical protein